MSKDELVTLGDVAQRYLATLGDAERVSKQVEVQRFVRWSGLDRQIARLQGQDVANYAETLANGATDASRRAQEVRAFLAFANSAGHTSTNLGTHLRLRKKSSTKKPRTTRPAPAEVPLTIEERAARESELASLKAQRPQLRQDIQRAMEDKDFRENAPLDAARQQKGFLEGRIQEIEATLANAVIVDAAPTSTTNAVSVGSTVVLKNLASGAEMTYTLAWPTDVDAAKGRISIESPVGRALLHHRAGDDVEVTAPSGSLHFRIERIES